MYALVDAVSYYASAEKVFDPSIRNKAVVVLTNNDGCICAVCPIARKLGVPKFIPYFKIKNFLAKNNVVIRSSNYELYADLSEKMMNVIARYCDNHYVYSIDESFLKFKNYRYIDNWHDYGHLIRKAVWKEVKLPVGVGFGLTPTLAKAANHASKKLSGYNGVAVIDNDKSRKEILSRMSLTDVWGIGNRLGKRLSILGIQNAWELANQDAKYMRQQFGVVVERTIKELNGTTCLNWDDVKQNKKEIFSTRSFGQRITEYTELRKALSSHGDIVARKTREQRSLIKRVLIFASSSPHDDNYYKRSVIYEFPIASDNTQQISAAISSVLNEIFVSGVFYYRCGVGAIELENSQFKQQDLFFTNTENPVLMSCYDKINQRYGAGSVQLASQGTTQKWQMRREFLSPSYTSKWRDIPKIIC
ncbi:Y-family DNA polymerase [Candidatus Colwellia aromaticivorans]|uniref:Y-family DNA polymerase n=1 Tax=Candidatus Colwellia aromaticivorans TaxID=2267621 RepID=UPI000DF21AC3|nr:Y-family DNA polymerase [Candidatus Colwellia aromaticivorans]